MDGKYLFRGFFNHPLSGAGRWKQVLQLFLFKRFRARESELFSSMSHETSSDRTPTSTRQFYSRRSESIDLAHHFGLASWCWCGCCLDEVWVVCVCVCVTLGVIGMLLHLFYCRGTQHFTGTVSNEATSEMGYPAWPAGRTCNFPNFRMARG